MPDRDLLRRSIRAGLLGGFAVIYLALVGMIEKFSARNLIGDTVTLGSVMLALPAFMAGLLAARPRVVGGQVRRPPPRPAVAAGLGAGLLTGGLTIAGVALVHAFPPGAVRGIFVSVSPVLLNILTFGQSLPLAAVILTLGGAALGGLGAGFRLLSRPARRSITVGLITTFVLALLQQLVPPMLYQLQRLLGLSGSTGYLYSAIFGGLTPLSATVVFLASSGLAALWYARKDLVRQRVQALPPQGRRTLNLVLLAVVAVVLLAIPYLVGSALSQILGTVGIFIVMGLGLNIVVGYAGLLDLGYVAFFAVGAYLTALITGAHVVTSLGAVVPPVFGAHLSFYAAIPVVILAAAYVGLLIGSPVLRLRGDYLAIVTLGFGEIARILITSDWLKPLLGGAEGLRDVTDAAIARTSFRDPQPFYYLTLAFILLAVFVSWRLANSRIGRAWNAMREDEQVAEAMGVSTVKYKLLAFALGASVGCLGGALFAVQIGSLAPTSFTILVSITVLAIVILGGMGSIPGVIVGALVLIGLPGLLNEFDEYRLLIYGAVLVGIMILRPQGLVPNVRRTRELTEEEREQDRWGRAAPAEFPEEVIAVGRERPVE